MLFNSYTFLIFFAVVLFVSRQRLPWAGKKLFLLVMSYLFYAAWNPAFVILLWISTVADWTFARGIYRAKGIGKRRAYLLASLGVNLGLLGYFKYGAFLLRQVEAISGLCGWGLEIGRPDITIPVGISFYTFQTLSYTLDIYRRKARPWHSFLDYALYVTFFPQLVAGPIVRATDFLPQCEQPKRGSARQIGWGLCLIVLGLFNKIVIADGLMAPHVEAVYDTARTLTFSAAWTGTLAFAVQIFCDFAGYSTIAIGVAMCMGFELPDNFHFPYAAIGFSDFWRRWHISLSSWLRDYLYIPLGGNRKGTRRTYANLAVTMLLGGLWHGASWMFVIWGGLHGVFLAVERLLAGSLGRVRALQYRLVRPVMAVGTFGCVCLAWVFFRARSVAQALGILQAMLLGRVDGHSTPIGLPALSVLLVTAATLTLHWLLRDTKLEPVARRLPWWLRSILLAAMLLSIFMYMSGEDRAFIYFQF